MNTSISNLLGWGAGRQLRWKLLQVSSGREWKYCRCYSHLNVVCLERHVKGGVIYQQFFVDCDIHQGGINTARTYFVWWMDIHPFRQGRVLAYCNNGCHVHRSDSAMVGGQKVTPHVPLKPQ